MRMPEELSSPAFLFLWCQALVIKDYLLVRCQPDEQDRGQLHYIRDNPHARSSSSDLNASGTATSS